MSSIFGDERVRKSDVPMRTGSRADIGILTAIDDDAGKLFEYAGLYLDLPSDHEYMVADRQRWLRCLSAGTVLISVDRSGTDTGFAAVGLLDGEPYLDQLSVRLGCMRRGIGTELLKAAQRIALQMGGSSLWLTTYRHLPWNRPFYGQHGFVVVPPDQWGMELAGEHRRQQRWLPLPHERVVMRKDLRGPDR